MIPVMKKVLRDFYGEKPEESKDYCRIGEEERTFLGKLKQRREWGFDN